MAHVSATYAHAAVHAFLCLALQGCAPYQKPSKPGAGSVRRRPPVAGKPLRQRLSLDDRLRAIQLFLDAGGDGRCDIPRVSGRDLDWSEFCQRLRGQSVVLTGLISGPEWTKEAFLEAHGHCEAKANDGFFDFSRTREITTVGEYLGSNASDTNIFLVERQAVGFLDTSPAPRMFDGFSHRPIFSLGVAGAPTRMHKHKETWLHLLAGRKAWWLGHNASTKIVLESQGDPCASLPAGAAGAARGGVDSDERPFLLCVQHAGETMYFGNLTPHATCNLDPFVLGVGAQGHTEGLPPPHAAARHGDLDGLRMALRGPGAVDGRDAANRTALQHGALIGHSAAVSLLLGARADPWPGEPQPLHSAAESGDLETARLLAAAAGTAWRRRDALGGEPLHYAAKGGHAPMLEQLLGLRASPRDRDADGAEPLHWAAAEGSAPVLKLLLARRGDVSAAADDGATPLHWAARAGHARLAKILLQAGASARAKDCAGLSPLHAARALGREDAVDLLAAVGDAAGSTDVAVDEQRREF